MGQATETKMGKIKNKKVGEKLESQLFFCCWADVEETTSAVVACAPSKGARGFCAELPTCLLWLF